MLGWGGVGCLRVGVQGQGGAKCEAEGGERAWAWAWVLGAENCGCGLRLWWCFFVVGRAMIGGRFY